MDYDEQLIKRLVDNYNAEEEELRCSQDTIISGNEPAFYDVDNGGFFLFGSDLVDVEHVDSITIESKVYSHIEKRVGFIPYENLTDKTKQLYALYEYDGIIYSKKLDGWELKDKVFSFAPFCSTYAQICDKKTYPVDVGNMVFGRTSNVLANLYIEFAAALAIGLKRGNTMKFIEIKKDDYVFRHCVFSYGYGNYLYVEYKAEDLINMDVSLLDKDDVSRLKNECEQIPIIKNSINPAVFLRPLTDAEKVECARFFLMNMTLSRENKEMKQFKVKTI